MTCFARGVAGLPDVDGVRCGNPDPQQDQYVEERHRHRYEVNPEMVPQLEERGLRFVGIDDSVGAELPSSPPPHPRLLALRPRLPTGSIPEAKSAAVWGRRGALL